MRTFFGIVAALVALFAGGCGVVYFVAGVGEELSCGTSYGIHYIAVLIGIIPGIIAGLIAWWALKKRPEPDEDSPNP